MIINLVLGFVCVILGGTYLTTAAIGRSVNDFLIAIAFLAGGSYFTIAAIGAAARVSCGG
jgi:hypothetical protein